jgi:polyisoprenoid-binding protein YceI
LYRGLGRVKGRFTRYRGTLDLHLAPAITLTIDATSVDTGFARRDRRLRAADFLDVSRYPDIRFVSGDARLDENTLTVAGSLSAAGVTVELEAEATVHRVDDGTELRVVTFLLQRWLGITWNPLGICSGSYTRLAIAGRLVPSVAIPSGICD